MRFKNFIVFSITIIILLLITLTASAYEYKSEVSVGLKYGPKAGISTNVSSKDSLNVYNAVTGDILYTTQPNELVTIEMGSTGFASWNKFDASGCPKISVQSVSKTPISCDGVTYRGYIYLERRTNGELLVINYVNTDEYVSSVLGKEMSYTWPIEALKAQAVCARNFVLTRGKTHSEYGFDVCKTTHCQVYGGVASEHANTRQAVNETAGVVATYQGNLVGLYFFATSGGATEDVENVWGGSYGYLRSVADPYENPEKASRYYWNVTLSRDDIEKKLIANGIKIGELKRIEQTSFSNSGRVLEMTFYGTTGHHTVKREKCRTILGLYSQRFTITGDAAADIKTTSGNATTPLYTISTEGIDKAAGYAAISGDNTISVLSINADNSNNYFISGGGYGHGVGMSQWGARGMAENGFTYDQILHHYFSNIELE